MKKIVRLTESDLVRIVKRVIAEDATAVASNSPWSLLKTPTPSNIAKVIFNAKGTFNDDETIVIAALSKITDKNMFNQVNTELNKLTGGQQFATYLNSFMQGDDFTRTAYNGKTVEDQLCRIFKVEKNTTDTDIYPLNKLNYKKTNLQKFSYGYNSN